jgi:2-dehydro-3-deoxygluconokinase
MLPSGTKVQRIVCIGEAMIELSLDRNEHSRATVGFAGDTLNTAIYCKRAGGPAVSVDFLTVFGRDPFSARMRAFIESEGVGSGECGLSESRIPGLYSITTNEDGERSFSYWRDNSAARDLFGSNSGVSLDVLGGFDLVFLSAITLAILPPAVRDALLQQIAALRQAGKIRFAFDSNWRPRLWPNRETARKAISRAWALADIALPSVDDETDLFGDAGEAEVLSRLNNSIPGDGALKRGSLGPLSLRDGLTLKDQLPVARPVDTTAAGDSFNGAFLAAIMRGKTMEAAMLDGDAYARAVIAQPGAIIPAASLPKIN